MNNKKITHRFEKDKDIKQFILEKAGEAYFNMVDEVISHNPLNWEKLNLIQIRVETIDRSNKFQLQKCSVPSFDSLMNWIKNTKGHMKIIIGNKEYDCFNAL